MDLERKITHKGRIGGGQRTWVYPLHAIGICVVGSHAQAVLGGDVACGLEVIAPPAGVCDNCVGGGERRESEKTCYYPGEV